MARVKITYGEFYDVPRTFVTKWHQRLFFFDCHFDENMDDYPDHFSVHELPISLATRLESMSWEGLADLGRYLGRIPVTEVSFSRKRRTIAYGAGFAGLSSIDDGVLGRLELD